MPSPRERLELELRAAMKAPDRERLSTLRLLLAEVANEELRRGAIGEPEFLAIVRKAIKQRKEASEQFTAGARPELAAKEEREAKILEGYLPPAASEDEIRAAVAAFVAAESLSGPQAIGAVMKGVLPRFAGRADGALVNRIAREILAGR